MSFFIRGNLKSSKQVKKFPTKKKNQFVESQKINSLENEEIVSESEDEDHVQKRERDESESEGEYETAQEKRIRLTKKYLEEIERQERLRLDNEADHGDAVAHRLREEVLEQAGKLRRTVASQYRTALVQSKCCKCRDQNKAPLCVVLHPNQLHIYVSSKDAVIAKYSLETCRPVGVIRRQKTKGELYTGHSTHILALAISSDAKFLASGCLEKRIMLWDPESLGLLHTFIGHRGGVTGLAFRRQSHTLYSCSQDQTIKIWSCDDKAYVETLFGHEDHVTSIDAGVRERCITSGGRDNSIRIWKIIEESQLVFTQQNSEWMEKVCLINEEYFLSCSYSGNLSLWVVSKKKPIYVVKNAHGIRDDNSIPNNISTITALQNTDLVASAGSCDGSIKLWCCEKFVRLVPVLSIPVVGFITSLVFTSSGDKLIASVAKEHRLGRWEVFKEVKNSVLVLCFDNKT